MRVKDKWMVTIEGKTYTVEVQLDPIGGEGEILVDGKVIKAWGGIPAGQRKEMRKHGRLAETGRWQTWEFEVGGKPAILQPKRAGLFGNPFGKGFELYVDGQKVGGK